MVVLQCASGNTMILVSLQYQKHGIIMVMATTFKLYMLDLLLQHTHTHISHIEFLFNDSYEFIDE